MLLNGCDLVQDANGPGPGTPSEGSWRLARISGVSPHLEEVGSVIRFTDRNWRHLPKLGSFTLGAGMPLIKGEGIQGEKGVTSDQ